MRPRKGTKSLAHIQQCLIDAVYFRINLRDCTRNYNIFVAYKHIEMKHTAAYWIEKLGLTDHVEGGAFAETYRSPLVLPKANLPEGHTGDRSAATAIYFLLQPGRFSAFHRIVSDELWHFYTGATVHVYEITAAGELKHHILGDDPELGQSFQCLIPGGSWFGSRIEAESGDGLVGCTVSPGFDFEDFELAAREHLMASYPEYADIIEQLTR